MFVDQTGGECVCSSSSSYLLEFLLPQSVCEAGRVALLVQIHLHELLDGQLTGGRVPELHQSDTRQEVRISIVFKRERSAAVTASTHLFLSVFSHTFTTLTISLTVRRKSCIRAATRRAEKKQTRQSVRTPRHLPTLFHG